MLALIILLATDTQGPPMVWVSGLVMINLAALLTMWSMAIYLHNAWPTIKSGLK
jgi:hypothetical protein